MACIERSASACRGAIRTGSQASHRSHTSGTSSPVTVSNGQPDRAVRVGRVARRHAPVVQQVPSLSFEKAGRLRKSSQNCSNDPS